MKKLLYLSIFTLLGLTLTGCVEDLKDQINFDEIQDKVFKENIESIGFSSLTTSSLLEQKQTDEDSFNLASKIYELQTQTTIPDIDDIDGIAIKDSIDDLSGYIDLFETLTSGNDLFNVEVTESTDPNYQYEAKYTIVNLDTTTTVYSMFYNITNRTFDSDYEGDEVKLSIEGILQNEEKTFDLTGTIEYEDDEIETEIKSAVDDNNYVIMKTESENDELSYSYEIYENNQLKEEFEIEIDLEYLGQELSLEFLKGNIEGEFEIKKQDSPCINYLGEFECLEIEYEINGIEGKIDVFEYTLNNINYLAFYITEDNFPLPVIAIIEK